MVEKRECPKCGGTLKEVKDTGKYSRGQNLVFCKNQNCNYCSLERQNGKSNWRGSRLIK